MSPPIARAWAGLVLVAVAASSTSLAAQEDTDPFASLNIGDELALLAEEDVVVSATRHAQPIEESPSAITVITREDIRASGYDDLADVMRLVPGADVIRMTPAQTAIGVRSGSSIAGDLLVVLVDGRDIRGHFLGQPVWSALSVDVDSIERIEVIRGPASTLYGSNAMQGVVNIVTREPGEDAATGEVTLHGAGPNTFSGDLRVHGRSGDVRWWVSAGHERGAPLDAPSVPDLVGTRARAWAGWRPAEDVDAVLEVGLLTVEGGFSSVLGPLQMNLLWPHASGRLKIGRTRIDLIADLNRFDGDMDPGLVMLGDTPEEDVTLATLDRTRYESRSLELSAHHDLDLFAGNRLTFGGIGRVIHHVSPTMVTCPEGVAVEGFDPAADCATLDLSELRGGLFLQDEWRLLETLTLTTGIRLDRTSINDDLGLSPRAALVWRFVPNQALRASFGRAYRQPSLIEARAHVALAPGDPGVPSDILQRVRYIFATQIGNEHLLNENATSYELGWRGRFLDGRLSASADAFYSRLSDTIWMNVTDMQLEPGFGGLPTLPTTAGAHFANSDAVLDTVGGELAVRWKATEWLDLGGAYAADLPLRAGGSIYGAIEPDHRVLVTARLRTPAGIRLSVDGLWASAYNDGVRDPRTALAPRIVVDLGDTFLVNATVGWAGTVGGVSVEGGIAGYNLVGEPFREAAGVDRDTLGSDGAMRLARQARLYLRGTF